jgi:hypothetical protein
MYQVSWTKSARAELAEIWVEGDSTLRASATTAAAQIDTLLSLSVGDAGESRDGNRRITFVPPLGVVFSVDEMQKRAKVLHVWPM